MPDQYDVFLSFKYSGLDGQVTRDYSIAKQLYGMLTEKGLSVFFSSVTLFNRGESEFKNAIDKALDSSKVLIVICTDARYVKTRWVEYEWNTFSNDILSNFKPDGTIYSFVSNEVNPKDLPRTLRNLQLFFIETDGFKAVVDYVVNRFKSPIPPPNPTVKCELNLTDSGKFMLNYKKNKENLRNIYRSKSDNILVSFVGNHKNDNLKKLSNSITHLLRALKGDRNILAEMFNDYVGMNRSDESETAEDLDTLNTDKWLAGCTKMINAIKDYEPKCPPGWVTARSISPFEFEFYMPESEKTKVRLMNRNCDRDYLSEVSRDLLINSIIPCMFKSMGDVEPGTVRDNNVLVDIDRYIIVFNQ